ncbi:SRPBCC family protein [Aquisalimonas sp.]|uniref:SRPBCC family protein n=1 Tax=unclassified Aquisalimonas TaxID=2644645 RepID=UPI0025C48EBA|nr:SRPBCC family protein [Aquisalimonas sp.]
MILRDSVKIEAAPEAVFGFFEDMESNYLEWHPDHVVFQWVSGRGLQEGNVFYFEEYIRGKLFKKRVEFTRVTPGRYIEFAPTFWLMRFFLPRMLFRMEPQPGGCEFIAEIHLRLGPLARRANAKDLDAVREHMRVEGVNIKRIVEARADG